MKLFTSKRLAVAIAALTTLVSGTAFAAASGWFHPSYVHYSEGLLVITVGADDFVGRTTGTPSGCSNQSLETLKLWHNSAQTAIATGKQVNIVYTLCGGTPYMSEVYFGP